MLTKTNFFVIAILLWSECKLKMPFLRSFSFLRCYVDIAFKDSCGALPATPCPLGDSKRGGWRRGGRTMEERSGGGKANGVLKGELAPREGSCTPHARSSFGGSQKVVSKRVVLADVPWTPKTGTRVEKTERRYPKTAMRVQKDGTTVPKTGTRVHSPKPPWVTELP